MKKETLPNYTPGTRTKEKLPGSTEKSAKTQLSSTQSQAPYSHGPIQQGATLTGPAKPTLPQLRESATQTQPSTSGAGSFSAVDLKQRFTGPAEMKIGKNDKATKATRQAGTSAGRNTYTMPSSEKWYKGDTPSARETLARIMTVSGNDDKRRDELLQMYTTAALDKTSPLYNPYAGATNSTAIAGLAGILQDSGIEMPEVITSDFLTSLQQYADYEGHVGIAGTPLAPTKKSTPAQDLAYYLYQLQKDEEATQKAESEWEALQAYIKEQVDAGHSDDEILEGINWGKYATLKRMDDGRAMNVPIQLNRGVGYSEDALYGALWAARNGGGSGSALMDAAYYTLGMGNMMTTVAQKPYNAAKDVTNYEMYNPYAELPDDFQALANEWGVSAITAEVLQQHRDMLSDPDQQKIWNAAYKAVATTEAVKTQMHDFTEWARKQISNNEGKKSDKRLTDAQLWEKIEAELESNSKYAALAKLETGRITGNPVALTEAVDFTLPKLKRELFGEEEAEAEEAPTATASAAREVQGPPVATAVAAPDVQVFDTASSIVNQGVMDIMQGKATKVKASQSWFDQYGWLLGGEATYLNTLYGLSTDGAGPTMSTYDQRAARLVEKGWGAGGKVYETESTGIGEDALAALKADQYGVRGGYLSLDTQISHAMEISNDMEAAKAAGQTLDEYYRANSDEKAKLDTWVAEAEEAREAYEAYAKQQAAEEKERLQSEVLESYRRYVQGAGDEDGAYAVYDTAIRGQNVYEYAMKDPTYLDLEYGIRQSITEAINDAIDLSEYAAQGQPLTPDMLEGLSGVGTPAGVDYTMSVNDRINLSYALNDMTFATLLTDMQYAAAAGMSLSEFYQAAGVERTGEQLVTDAIARFNSEYAENSVGFIEAMLEKGAARGTVGDESVWTRYGSAPAEGETEAEAKEKVGFGYLMKATGMVGAYQYLNGKAKVIDEYGSAWVEHLDNLLYDGLGEITAASLRDLYSREEYRAAVEASIAERPEASKKYWTDVLNNFTGDIYDLGYDIPMEELRARVEARQNSIVEASQFLDANGTAAERAVFTVGSNAINNLMLVTENTLLSTALGVGSTGSKLADKLLGIFSSGVVYGLPEGAEMSEQLRTQYGLSREASAGFGLVQAAVVGAMESIINPKLPALSTRGGLAFNLLDEETVTKIGVISLAKHMAQDGFWETLKNVGKMAVVTSFAEGIQEGAENIEGSVYSSILATFCGDKPFDVAWHENFSAEELKTEVIMGAVMGPLLSAYGADFSFIANGGRIRVDYNEELHTAAQQAAGAIMDHWQTMPQQELLGALTLIQSDMRENQAAYNELALVLDAAVISTEAIQSGALDGAVPENVQTQFAEAQAALAQAQRDVNETEARVRDLSTQHETLERKATNGVLTDAEQTQYEQVIEDLKTAQQDLTERKQNAAEAQSAYAAVAETRNQLMSDALNQVRSDALATAKEQRSAKLEAAQKEQADRQQMANLRVSTLLDSWNNPTDAVAKAKADVVQAQQAEEAAQKAYNEAVVAGPQVTEARTVEQVQTEIEAEEQTLAKLEAQLEDVGSVEQYDALLARIATTQQSITVLQAEAAQSQEAPPADVEADATEGVAPAAPAATVEGEPVETAPAEAVEAEAPTPEAGEAPSTAVPRTDADAAAGQRSAPLSQPTTEVERRRAALQQARDNTAAAQARLNALSQLRDQVLAAAQTDRNAAAGLLREAVQSGDLSVQSAWGLANEAGLPLADIGGIGAPGVYYEGLGRGPRLDAVKQTQVNMLGAFAKRFGVEIILRDQLAAGQVNGGLIDGTNRMYLGLNTISDGILHYGVHEMTHFIAQNNVEGFNSIKTAVISYLTGHGVDFSAAVRDKADVYAPEGADHAQYLADNYAKMEEEVICDSLSQMFADKAVLRQMAKDNPDLVQGPVRRWFLNFWKKLATVVKDIAGGTGEAEVSALLGDNKALMNLYELFTENGEIAGEEYRKYAPKAATTAEGASLSISTLDTWEKDLRQRATDQGIPLEEIERAVQTVRKQADELLNLANAGEEDRRLLTYVYRGPEVATSIRGGNMAPIRSNVEYVWTFDLDTNCPKRLRYANIVNYVENQIHRQMTETECRNLLKIMVAVDEETPCSYCYVEGKRMAMAAGYNQYLSKRHDALESAGSDEAAIHEALTSAFGTAAAPTIAGLAENAAYNPTRDQLYEAVAGVQRAVFDYLDDHYPTGSAYSQLPEGTYDYHTPDKSVNKLVEEVAGYLGISRGEASDLSGDVAAELKRMVSSWLFDAYAKADHVYMAGEEIVATPGQINGEALALHHKASNYAKSFSQARNMDNYVPYTNQASQVSLEDKEVMNAHGGFRVHSSNDYRPDYIIDYMQFFADLEADQRNSKGGDTPEGWFVHCYTKAADFVKIFAPTGARINMSIAMYGDDTTGIKPNFKEGMDWNEAMALRHDYQNAGTMAMVVNDDQLSFALNSPWIDMCIPFHASGMRQTYYNLMGWFDYTAKQNEVWPGKKWFKAQLQKDGVNTRGKNVTEEFMKRHPNFGSKGEIYTVTGAANREYVKEHGELPTIADKNGEPSTPVLVRYKPHFLPGSVTIYAFTKDGTYLGPMEVEGHGNDKEKYLSLCEEWGVVPRFSGLMVKDAQGNPIDIVDHPSYMKVIYETARVDTPQQYVTANFDTSRVIDSLRGFVGKQERDLSVTENVGSTRGGQDSEAAAAADLFLRNLAGKETIMATPEEYAALERRAKEQAEYLKTHRKLAPGDVRVDLSQYEVMPEEIATAQRTIHESLLNKRTQAARDMGAYTLDAQEFVQQLEGYRAEEAAEGRFYGAEGGSSYYSGNEATEGASLSRNRLQSNERIFRKLYDGIGVQLTVDRVGFAGNANTDSYSNMRTGATHVRSSAVQNAGAYIHELARQLDFRTNITGDQTLGAELEHVAQYALDPMDYMTMTQQQRRDFGLEEYITQYLRYGNVATRAASGAALNDAMNAAFKRLGWIRAMRIASLEYSALMNASAADQAMARIDYAGPARPSADPRRMAELIEFKLGDRTYPMLRLTRLMKSQLGSDYRISEDPRELLLSNPNLGANFSETIIEGRLVDPQGTTINEHSIQSILHQVPSNQRDDFLNYWTLLHSRDRDTNGNTVYGLTPEDTATRDAAIAQYEQEHPEWLGIIDAACDWMNQFVQAWVVDTGGMTQKQFDEMKALYPHHIPTYRADYFFGGQKYEGSSGGRPGQQHTKAETVGNGLQGAPGSARDLIDPALGITQYIQGIVAAEKNREAFAAFADAIRRTADNADIAEIVQTPEMDPRQRANNDPVTPDNPLIDVATGTVRDSVVRHGDGLFTVRDLNGELVTVQIHSPLIASALLNTEPREISRLMQSIGWLKKLITVTATAKSLRFSGQNVFGDWFVSWVTGSYASNPGTGAIKWFLGASNLLYNKVKDALGADTSNAYKAYELFGHMQSRYSLSRATGRKEARAAVLGQNRFQQAAETFRGTRGTTGSPVKGLLQFIREGTAGLAGAAIEQVTDLSENSTRYTEFLFGRNRNEQTGLQRLNPAHTRDLSTYDARIEAGRAAQEVTTNFQKHGDSKLLKEIGLGVPFMGAAIQGTNKALMTFSSQNEGKRLSTAAKLTEVAFLAIAYALWQNGWSDEDKELYDQYQSDYKMKYYFIPTDGEGHFLRVKKGQDALFQLADGIGTMIARYSTGIGDDLSGDVLELAGNVLREAGGFTTVLDPILSVGRNLTWWGGQIENYRDQQRAEQDRYDEDTFILWKLASNSLHAAGIEWSPKDVEYVVRQYLGSYGTILGKSLETATEGKLDFKTFGSIVWDRIASGYVVDAMDGSQATQVFYACSDQIDQMLTTAKAGDDAFYLRADYGTPEFDEAISEAETLQERIKDAKKEIKALWTDYSDAVEAEDEEGRREVKYEILRLCTEMNADIAAFFDEYGYPNNFQRAFYNNLKLLKPYIEGEE